MPAFHVPVLLSEVIHGLALSPNQDVIDATVGHGGHTEAILNATAPQGRVLACDRDERNLAIARERLAAFAPRVLFVHGSFVELTRMVSLHGFAQVQGILFDLGFSSSHVDDPTRGFSFLADGPLDMRYDRDQALTAADIVNTWSVEELERIFLVLGEETSAQRFAQGICERRKNRLFKTTGDLVEVIAAIAHGRGKIHPATKVFQALRIAVNDELKAIKETLPQALSLLAPQGRLAVISFHSLEDRLVKRFGQEHRDELRVLTAKPIVASQEEIRKNPRARSAKLRLFERL